MLQCVRPVVKLRVRKQVETILQGHPVFGLTVLLSSGLRLVPLC